MNNNGTINNKKREEKGKEIVPRHELIRISDPAGIRQVMKNYSINIISKNCYAVKSLAKHKSYRITKLPEADVWTCECQHFMLELSRGNKEKCKHILACEKLSKIMEIDENIEEVKGAKVCPHCHSTTIGHHGYRILKSGVRRQKYQCKQCQYCFSLRDDGFAKVNSDPRIVTEALNLVFSGMSYRNTAAHISLAHQVKISHVSVRFWFKKYTLIMKE